MIRNPSKPEKQRKEKIENEALDQIDFTLSIVPPKSRPSPIYRFRNRNLKSILIFDFSCWRFDRTGSHKPWLQRNQNRRFCFSKPTMVATKSKVDEEGKRIGFHFFSSVMAIKVHGIVISGNVMRVITCLLEKELAFELVPVNLATGEHKSEAFLSLNPFGQIPAFEDGDLKLFESRAITKYIAHAYADKGNSQLILRDPKKMGIVSVWLEVEALQFHKPASELAFEIAVKPLLGMTTDEAVVEENEPKLATVLDIYETRLAQSKYLGGDCFTLVDLHHQPNIQYLMETKIKKLFDSRPNVSAWCKDILARPAWLKVVEMRKNA